MSSFSFGQDKDKINKNNLVYSTLDKFRGSGNFFLGDTNFDHAYVFMQGYNFNDAFHPMITSDACNGTVNTPGVAVWALPSLPVSAETGRQGFWDGLGNLL